MRACVDVLGRQPLPFPPCVPMPPSVAALTWGESPATPFLVCMLSDVRLHSRGYPVRIRVHVAIPSHSAPSYSPPLQQTMGARVRARRRRLQSPCQRYLGASKALVGLTARMSHPPPFPPPKKPFLPVAFAVWVRLRTSMHCLDVSSRPCLRFSTLLLSCEGLIFPFYGMALALNPEDFVVPLST